MARVGRRLGGGVLNTAIGFSIFAALGQPISPKENIENIRSDAINGLELEHNRNLVEVKMGAGSTIIVAIIVIGCIGICAKSLLKCIKCKKIQNCIKKDVEKKKEETEDSFESFKLEDI